MKYKFVAAIVVILILIGLPIGSYLYLRSGYMYRLNALEELQSKGELSQNFYCFNAADSIRYESLKGNTILLSSCGVESELKTKITLLEEQFSDAPTFKSLRLEGNETMKNMDYSNCYFSPQIFYDELFNNSTFVLIDTSLSIRNYYKSDENSFKTLVEHLAIILPRKKEKKIEFQRK